MTKYLSEKAPIKFISVIIYVYIRIPTLKETNMKYKEVLRKTKYSNSVIGYNANFKHLLHRT